jgi:hypothetical protein
VKFEQSAIFCNSRLKTLLKIALLLVLVLAGGVALPWPAFLMSWRRRIGKEDESIFFNGCEKAGLQVKHIGSRVYCISPIENEKSNKMLDEKS